MSDDRIPKVLMYSQLDTGKRNVGRPWLRYKDKLKSNLTGVNVPLSTFEQEEWRGRCHDGIRNFEASHLERLQQAKARTKAALAIPTTSSRNLVSCSFCGLLCKSPAYRT